MKYWLTTHFASSESDPDDVKRDIYLQDGKQHVAAALRPGDRVYICEAKGGTPEIGLKDGVPIVIPRRTGRQGIVTIATVAKPLTDRHIGPTKYADGSERWWRWIAKTRDHVTDGFVPLAEVNEHLGYKRGSVLRGFGDANSGLMRIEQPLAAVLERAFRRAAKPPLPDAIQAPRYPRAEGPEGESDEHRLLKEFVAEHAGELLDEPDVAILGIEHTFATQDRADIALQDSRGQVIGVEIELEQDEHQLEGLLQAVKYRFLLAVAYRKRFEGSRSLLVAYRLAKRVKQLAMEYNVQWVEVDRARVARWRNERGRQ